MHILASWDDGDANDLKIAELMTKYSIPTIFYWPYMLGKSKNFSKVKKALTMNQCRELSKKFEVGSHGYKHLYLTNENVTELDFRLEIIDSKKMWEDELGKPIKSFCYPRGRHNEVIQDKIKHAGYSTARTVLVGNIEPVSNPYAIHPTVHVGYQRAEYGTESWFDYAIRYFEQAKKKPDAVFHIFGHSWEIEQTESWDQLQDLLRTINT